MMSKTTLVPWTQLELVPIYNYGQPFTSIQFVPFTQMIPTLEPIDYVYRVLRPNESEQAGITAKDPLSDVGAAYHVAWGSDKERKEDSRFISTCLNLSDAEHFLKVNNQDSGHLVRIDLQNWQTENNITDVICVFDGHVREDIIINSNIIPDWETIDRFHNFANAHNEVLLVGNVPPDKINIIEYSIKSIFSNCMIP